MALTIRSDEMSLPQPFSGSAHWLVLFAHGSRDDRWRATFEGITRRVTTSLAGASVKLAYLQMADPTLATVAAEAARSRVRHLTVLPLFFSAGGHVANDVPRIVAAVRDEHPDLEVTLLPPVGEDERFVELVVQLSRESLRDS